MGEVRKRNLRIGQINVKESIQTPKFKVKFVQGPNRVTHLLQIHCFVACWVMLRVLWPNESAPTEEITGGNRIRSVTHVAQLVTHVVLPQERGMRNILNNECDGSMAKIKAQSLGSGSYFTNFKQAHG